MNCSFFFLLFFLDKGKDEESEINTSLFDKYTSDQLNYFGSYLDNETVFYQNNSIYKLIYLNSQLSLEEIFNKNFYLGNKDQSNSINYFQNVTGLIGYQNMIIIFLKDCYSIYRSIDDFKSKFFQLNQTNLNPISELLEADELNLDKLNADELSLLSVNLIKDKLIFRFKELNYNELIINFKKIAFESEDSSLSLNLDSAYKIDKKNCFIITQLAKKSAFPLDFKFKNLVILISIIVGGLSLITLLVTLVRSKTNDPKYQSWQKLKKEKSKNEKNKNLESGSLDNSFFDSIWSIKDDNNSAVKQTTTSFEMESLERALKMSNKGELHSKLTI